MIWRLITVGKPALPWAKSGLDDYLSRLKKYTRVEHMVVKEGPREQVENQLLELSKDSFRVVLDERGKARRSLDLASWVQKLELHGTKKISLLIGGADGHTERMRKEAQECWCLSTFTLQHEVALVVLMEQVYRAYTILRKEPYHRE